MSPRRGNGPGRGGPAKGAGQGGRANGFDKRHPAFETGNTEAVTHGAHSELRVVPLLELARSEIVEHAPWLDALVFRPALDAWARIEAQIALVQAWLDVHNGPLDDEGKPKPAAEFLVRLENAAADRRTRLGLDPTSAVKLQKDLGAAARSWNLARLIDEGRLAYERAEGRPDRGSP